MQFTSQHIAAIEEEVKVRAVFKGGCHLHIDVGVQELYNKCCTQRDLVQILYNQITYA